jgi:hypothetical protein
MYVTGCEELQISKYYLQLLDLDKSSWSILYTLTEFNLILGLVGLLSSLIVLFHFKDRIPNAEFIILTVLSFLMSSGIDIDHFIAARSFHIHVRFQSLFRKNEI